MRSRHVAVPAVLLAAALLGSAFAGSASGRELITGFDDGAYKSLTPSTRALAFERTTAANGRIARIGVNWSTTARTRPQDPFNPADRAYDFRLTDGAVNDAAAHGLDVLLTVGIAPPWAEGPGRAPNAPAGSWRPDPGAYAAFATALARRYSGGFVPPGGQFPLPRVRFFQAWNEPNLSQYLTPQYEGEKAVSPGIYRVLLNRFYAAIKSVIPDNVVVTAGTAPFGDSPGGARVRPLAFWRRLLCLKGRRDLKPVKCPLKARFNVAAHHPLNTVGGARDSADHPDDVVMPDMRHLRRVIRIAEQRKRAKGARRHPLWATEFWWETSPPDPRGVSLQRQARFIQEAFYVLFNQGVRVALMIGLQDSPYEGIPGPRTLQSGLFDEHAQAKPSAQAFRFPFVVARLGKGRAEAWTIAPQSGIVVIERLAGGSWTPVRERSVSRFQVVRTTVPLRRGRWRATIDGESSLEWRFRPKR